MEIELGTTARSRKLIVAKSPHSVVYREEKGELRSLS